MRIYFFTRPAARFHWAAFSSARAGFGRTGIDRNPSQVALNFPPAGPMKGWGIGSLSPMSGLQLSGLASGLDWKSLVDQLMEIERTPITRLTAEQTRTTSENSALTDLGTRLASLQTAVTALKGDGLFATRSVALSGTGWTAAAATGTTPASHEFALTQLATATRREGTADAGSGLAPDADVSGLTIATLATSTPVTAGVFTVNGQRITVALDDSLADVFAAIGTATGGDVTASYDAATDRVTLNGTGEVTLGAANDSSNFLRVLKLTQNGGDTVTSTGALGALRTTGPLTAAGLRTAVTAVDGTGAGEFAINGVTIAYNVNTDSLGAVLKRISQSDAGVTARFDAVNDRVLLTNAAGGDLGLVIDEAAGGLLGALGLTGTSALVRGHNTEFSVDGGATLSHPGTTLDATAHGLAGLTLTAGSTGTQVVTIAADTAAMRTKLDTFVSAYNAVQSYIEDRTRITTASGKVTTSVLSSNREVQAWAGELRSLAFGAVAGQRLENFGIDFKSGSNQLEVKDATKLETALRDRPAAVEAFFQQAGTGFAAKLDTRLTALTAANGEQQERLTKTNRDLDRQIADIERRLVQQREQMEAAFIRMEEAQSRISSQSDALTRAFSTSTST